ncbi:cbb3-type cytochrome oxidase assembly protein CcoS [Sandaracinomonas limnophila]|uniref:Cbb3-type cytochrome oxidase assembly protein CcoS n=1 Tax=Sandaracinomonas limnophila TaxID=1862386 RepID=A0A437PWG0_9BACT|nr:cbb3-type cytochrome oxidase assembly protein CcoS [Sandaracinomonas limnophila]RVU26580.1 cbb3-type cytochrome oxidase assembly protein CcoS [Sandaracinomonas limnophila]
MDIIYVLISVSFVLALGFLGAFIWSVKSGQQNDLVTPGMRILMDEIKSDSEKK